MSVDQNNDRFKNLKSKVKSIRSQGELEFLGLKERDETKPRSNRIADLLGIKMPEKKVHKK